MLGGANPHPMKQPYVLKVGQSTTKFAPLEKKFRAMTAEDVASVLSGTVVLTLLVACAILLLTNNNPE